MNWINISILKTLLRNSDAAQHFYILYVSVTLCSTSADVRHHTALYAMPLHNVSIKYSYTKLLCNSLTLVYAASNSTCGQYLVDTTSRLLDSTSAAAKTSV